MVREEALKRVSEVSCAYHNVRMIDCPHCAKDVELLVKILMELEEKGEGDDSRKE